MRAKRAAKIAMASIAYWVIGIGIVIALDELFPPDICNNILWFGKCARDRLVFLGTGLSVLVVVYGVALWALARRHSTKGL